MYTFLVVLYAIACIFLILVVLLQTGKGSGMGAAFGGSNQTVFGARGKTTPLQKITAVMAVLFMSLSVLLAAFSLSEKSDLYEPDAPLGTPGKEAGMAGGPEDQSIPPADQAASPEAAKPAEGTATVPAPSAPAASPPVEAPKPANP